MKLSPRDAQGFFEKPDPRRAGVLIFGADPMRVAVQRQKLLAALLGPGAEEEMRLTRLPGAVVSKDPAQLQDAAKAVGFFPGQRAVFVEDAPESCVPAIATALEDWNEGDAQIVVTAGQLRPTSKLRKLFEAHKNAFAAAIYDDPPSRAEVERALLNAGIGRVAPDSLSALVDLAGSVGPGDLTQILEKLALYKRGDDTQLSLDDIEACAPQSTEAALDDVLNIVAEARSGEIGPLIRKLQAQGTTAVSLCIGATRHFRTLYTAASDPGGPAQGVGRLRPPVFGPRRDRLLRQAQAWSPDQLQKALTVLTDTDLHLRSAGQTAPAMALIERALIRLAMMERSR